ncbi:SIR2 family protein [Loktanella sp. F6476L]|uniref:SIR2 family protein n=1 Tax=Loktanella sp. F6476L TaxID=2926405 RepID=UPI001FF4A501|nr:SIR2 family protein [Loktanella sp. F6476L]MCK0120507.1 SIR2 family protein [Loktanella sp. F6476L]
MTKNGITSELATELSNSTGAPFLFVGSGFSRRYIGLEQWDELLEKFTKGLKDYGYYVASADGSLPEVAALIAEDFHEYWWSAPHFEDSRKEHGDKVKKKSSAIKFELSKYLRDKGIDGAIEDGMNDEIQALRKLNVDGVITTNWDMLVEEIFPDYRVFVGQEELIFSNPQSIAEIYKIHGCATQPDSLVLTSEDYSRFDQKYPYLVAKLITIFIEHPVIFLGYSLADKNIQDMLSSIARCLSPSQVEIFSKNLYFVQRMKGQEQPSIAQSIIQIGESNVSIQLIRTNDFSEVYEAIESVKRKVPARVLRFCKEQMYELVKSNEPQEKLSVVDFDGIESHDDIEFVVGIGVAKEKEAQKELAKSGYKGISLEDLFRDVVLDDKDFHPATVIEEVFPAFKKLNNTFFPGYKYLYKSGIKSLPELSDSEYSPVLSLFNKYGRKRFEVEQYRGQFNREASKLTTSEIIANFPADRAAVLIPFQPDAEIELPALANFLSNNLENLFNPMHSYASSYRKLAVFYDMIRHGF